MTDIAALIAKILFAAGATTAAAPSTPAAPAKPATTTPAAKKTLTASEVVDEVQKFYAGINNVTAKFRQTVKNATFGTEKTSDGMVYLSKPGKMRWDYMVTKKKKSTLEKSFISDGKTLYVVELDNLQIMKKSLDKDLMPVAVSFLFGKGDLKNEFKPELDTTGTYGSKGEIVLKLTPKTASAQYKALYLIVNPDNYRVTQSVIIDSSDNQNQFRFYSPDFKKEVATTLFSFDPKDAKYKNYRVVDADQPQPAPGNAKPATTPATPAKK